MTKTTSTYLAPPVYAGRIDELLEDGIRLTEHDTRVEAQRLRDWAKIARAERITDRDNYTQARAPLWWIHNLDALAEWIGWR